jgi:hypothetical protein
LSLHQVLCTHMCRNMQFNYWYIISCIFCSFLSRSVLAICMLLFVKTHNVNNQKSHPCMLPECWSYFYCINSASKQIGMIILIASTLLLNYTKGLHLGQIHVNTKLYVKDQTTITCHLCSRFGNLSHFIWNWK